MYVRPEALYSVREDRANTGLILGSTTDSARVDWGQVGELGEALLAMLARSADGIDQPAAQSDFTDRGRAFRKPLLELANLQSWEAFVDGAMLISVRRVAATSYRLAAWLRVPNRSWGFHPTGDLVLVEQPTDAGMVGQAIEGLARSQGFGPASG